MSGSNRAEVRLKGLPLSEGLAVARVCMFNENRHRDLPQYRVSGEEIEREVERLNSAIAVAGQRLEQIRGEVAQRIGDAEAEIFVAHKMIMEDRSLHDRIRALIRDKGVNVETAVTRVLDGVESQLRDVDDEYIKERATDFGEIRRRLLDVLGGTSPSLQCSNEGHCLRGRNRVVVAEELTPSLTIEIDSKHVLGFLTERGGANSHAAILARALGVPAVSGLPGVRTQVGCGTEVLVNGTTGEVIVWPTDETIRIAKEAGNISMRSPIPMDPVKGFRVQANISMASEVKDALEMKAEGIGLYRTEIEVIAAGRMLSEDELYERYASVRRALGAAPLVIRLFDIGSDKVLPSLELPREDNPALGWRGTRLLLGRPDILSLQARAVARASAEGEIHVLYPMIVDAAQFVAARKVFEEAAAGVPHGRLVHGAMFEVPSACLQAAAILREADFASIGSNDLIQYLFAVDRGNDRVAQDHHAESDVFWGVVSGVAEAGRIAGKPVSLCGEIGGDPRYVSRLRDAGIHSVSVNPRRISLVRSVAGAAVAGA